MRIKLTHIIIITPNYDKIIVIKESSLRLHLHIILFFLV